MTIVFKPANDHTPWQDNARQPLYPPLLSDQRAECCVIGAGISGLSIAYALQQADHDVLLIDQGAVGGGESAATTAHLSHALDDGFETLEKLKGSDVTRLVAQSQRAGFDYIRQIIAREKIDCEFEKLDGYLFCGPDDDIAHLKAELTAAHRAGIDDVELIAGAPLPHYDTGPALRWRNQGQFHLQKYLNGLSRAFLARGGRIFGATRANGMDGDETGYAIHTSRNATIQATQVVVATHSPDQRLAKLHARQKSYRSYTIAAKIPKNTLPPALYWDTEQPYHYVRIERKPREHFDLLLMGGEDHPASEPVDESRYAKIEFWGQRLFPYMQDVTHRWNGTIMEPDDYIGFIGRLDADHPNIFVCSGDSGHGILQASLGAILITDLIEGRENPWEDIYRPDR